MDSSRSGVSPIGRYADYDFAEIERAMVESLAPALARFSEAVDLTSLQVKDQVKDAVARIHTVLSSFVKPEHPRGRRYEVASAARARRRMR